MHRMVGQLLHAPTVRVKELGESRSWPDPVGDSYKKALRVLFDLDPD